MKKLLNVIILALALNFLAVAGGIGYLVYAGGLDREKVAQIREILFPPPAPETTEDQAGDPTTQPSMKLDELLAKYTGFSSTEKLEQVQQTFDAQMAQMERRRQELTRLQQQIDLAKQQLAEDRAALAREEEALRTRQEEAVRLESDQGFQDSLALYRSMPAKQVKQIFLGLDDETIIRYLQAMPQRTAAKIIKEFKAPDEISRIQRIMEQMRQAEPAESAQGMPSELNASTEGP